jgi:hypothetical protein
MKLYVCTKAHLPRIHTPATGLTSVLDTTWIVHTDEDRGRLARHLAISPSSVHVANPPPLPGNCPPIGWIRDWVCKNLAARGEWMAWADDNIRRVAVVSPEHYHAERLEFAGMPSHYWRAAYRHEAGPHTITMLLGELAAKCDAEGTIYGGFAPEDNYYFRPRKWRVPTGYVKTKLAVYKNDGSSWYPFDGCMFEDFVKSVDVAARYGAVVINNFARPENKYWEAGGIGAAEFRRPFLAQNVEWLMARYPGLVKRHKTIDTHVQFVPRTRKQLARWREENGYAAAAD